MVNNTTVSQFLEAEYGAPSRSTVKIRAWELGSIGVALQVDQPNREEAAYIWLPYPNDGDTIPEIAFEYAAESGRHSGTYASTGLEKGKPALKVVVRSLTELAATLNYVRAMAAKKPLPTVAADGPIVEPSSAVDVSAMPSVELPKARREAIPRTVQREVWQRDVGQCVECSSNERLCFDHIVPFSRGGSNTVRNIQLMCERCNLSKGNRI